MLFPCHRETVYSGSLNGTENDSKYDLKYTHDSVKSHINYWYVLKGPNYHTLIIYLSIFKLSTQAREIKDGKKNKMSLKENQKNLPKEEESYSSYLETDHLRRQNF